MDSLQGEPYKAMNEALQNLDSNGDPRILEMTDLKTFTEERHRHREKAMKRCCMCCRRQS